jgi:hypothetical protein
LHASSAHASFVSILSSVRLISCLKAVAAAVAAAAPQIGGGSEALLSVEVEQAGGAAAMGHPYAPADLELPGFVPLRLSQVQILVTYIGASVFVLLAVWLVSGTHTLPAYSSCVDLLLLIPSLPSPGDSIPPSWYLKFRCPKL